MKDSQISVIEDEISKFEQSLSTVNESVMHGGSQEISGSSSALKE